MVSDGTWTYTWEHGRQLAGMSDGDTIWSYTYDADGLRTKRTDGDTTYEYVYYDGLLQCMFVNGTPLYFTHTPDGAPMGVVYQKAVYFYVTNLQGDVVALVRPSGEEVVRYTYDAWGNVLSITGNRANAIGAINPIRYRGYVYDRETGLYYLQSRYYNPEMGRFISVDGVVSDVGGDIRGYNLFAYSFNNPVNMSDLSGNWPQWIKNTVKAVVNWFKKVVNDKKESIKKLSYNSNGTEEGAQISNSYMVNDPVVMYNYVNENRGDDITGSTTGVVAEWVVHNAAYNIGKAAVAIGFEDIGNKMMLKGQDLDIGSTIYDDNHGIATGVMWLFYAYVSPSTAMRDLVTEVFE